MNPKTLETQKVSTLFVKYAIPSVLAMLLTGVQSIIDGLFLGNFIDYNAMASVNIASPFMHTMFGITFIITTGACTFIGRMLGAGNIEKSRDIFKTSFIAVFVLGVSMLLLGVFLSDEIAMLLGANDVLLSGSSEYIRALAFFVPTTMFSMFIAFINRVNGYPTLFLISNIVSIFANIGLNYVFIVLLELGMTGAACATGASFVISFLVGVYPILNKKNEINVFVGKFNFKLLGQLTYNGSSEGVTSASSAISTYLFNSTFMAHYGEIGVAAFTTIGYISQMVALTMFGISDGISPILSYNYGANRKDRVRDTLKLSVVSNLIIGILAYVVIIFFGEGIISMFADGEIELVNIAYGGSIIFASSFLLSGFNILISGYFTALGKAKESIIISASRGLIFVAVGIAVLPLFLDTNGVWAAVPFADVVALFISLFLLYRTKKGGIL